MTMTINPPIEDLAQARESMVQTQLIARGIGDPRLIEAMRSVRREAYVDEESRVHAYEDSPLALVEGQTISQPWIVAVMIEALGLSGDETVLEVGTGSGYAAAVLARLAASIVTLERRSSLAVRAQARLMREGVHNVEVILGDGTRGWPEHAPYDAILVSAGGPRVPESLRQQLALGGRLVMPVGHSPRAQVLSRITREGVDRWREEPITDVRFVPLVGAEGWSSDEVDEVPARRIRAAAAVEPVADGLLSHAIARHCEPFDSVEQADLRPLLERIGNARVVLIGESTHGSAEFQHLRQRITRALIELCDVRFIALEADWPEVAVLDRQLRPLDTRTDTASLEASIHWPSAQRFPDWLWRNRETQRFLDWLGDHNRQQRGANRPGVALHGLDLYSLHESVDRVLHWLESTDPAAASRARERYACLDTIETDPVHTHRPGIPVTHECERAVLTVLGDLLGERSRQGASRHDEGFFDAVQNARVVARAQGYYRSLLHGSRSSWNLRDQHMFETLCRLLDHHGPDARAIVWAHNSHVGNAAATDRASCDEISLGQLCREAFGQDACLIGAGTHQGLVTAASVWGGPVENKPLRPGTPGSVERLMHEAGKPGFVLPLRRPYRHPALEALDSPRLQRAVGVIYRPERERESHLFESRLASQFDEYLWIDQTTAITPLSAVVTHQDRPA
jgi:protein-L-isoaspartate(D-aspartate) O-methyltransferase